MRRYITVTVVVGVAVSALVLFLYRQNAFAAPARELFAFFDSIRLFPEPGAEHRLNLALQAPVFVALAFAMAWVTIDLPRTTLKMVIGLATLLLVLGLSPTMALYGVAFEPFSCILSGLFAFLAGITYAGTGHGERKQSLAAILGSRVTTETFHQVLGSSKAIDFEGDRRELSVLTCRVFNQAEMMEKLDPSDVVEITNLFIKSTVDRLMSLGGYLDESSPDCVRFLFGLESRDRNHAAEACRAALELRQRLDNLSSECESRWHLPLRYGIGIAPGPITLGVFGSASHVYFSGIGPDVDLSRRLSRTNAKYGSRILLSAMGYVLAKDEIEVRPVDMLYIPQSSVVAEVYELLAERNGLTEEQHDSRDAFWQGMIYFRNGNYDSALEMFSKARIDTERDLPLEYYIARTQDYLVHPERIPAGQPGAMEGVGAP